MALGAQASDVLKMILRQGLALLFIGIAIGLAGAFALTRAMTMLLFEVSAYSPLRLQRLPCLRRHRRGCSSTSAEGDESRSIMAFSI